MAVRDPAGIKHFLKDSFNIYTKPSPALDPIFHYFRLWLGDGIFPAGHGIGAQDGGKNWAVQRKIAANIFSRGNFSANMHQVFSRKAYRLCDLLEGPSRDGVLVDMQQHFFNFTMDSIMNIFFGEDSDIMGGDSNAYGEAFDIAHSCFFLFTVKGVPFSLITKTFFPWPFGGHNGLCWRLREALSPTFQRFRKAQQTLDAESRRMVEACRRDPQISERRDLLALFVQSEEKQRFSTELLRDVVLSFVIAGRDTTACTLSWLFYILATHPELQEKVCAEIDIKLQGETPSFAGLTHSKLPYLHGLLYETLRLYPPVPADFKEAQEDDQLPDGTPVPRHTKLAFLPYSMGRDSQVYAEPEVVRPERWIPFTAPSPYEFPVFQAGPRICLGMDMAIFEAKLLACKLLQRYTFSLAPGEAEKITYSMKVTMSISNDKGQSEGSEHLWLCVHRRDGA